MKRIFVFSLLFALALSTSALAVTVTVKVSHAAGGAAVSVTGGDYTTVGDACGNALTSALSLVQANDVVLLPAVSACNINLWLPIPVKIMGLGPENTILTPSGDQYISANSGGGTYVLQDLSFNFQNQTFSDWGPLGLDSGDAAATLILRNVNLTFYGNATAIVTNADDVVPLNVVLDHVNISCTTNCNSIANAYGSTTIADSKLVAVGSGRNVISVGGTGATTTISDSTLTASAGLALYGTNTVNLLAGTVLKSGGSSALTCNSGINVYPGTYISAKTGTCIPKFSAVSVY